MDGSWRRLLHDPQTGGLLDLGRRTYRPSAALARYVRARDRTCIFPFCNRRAETCDLDHAVPHRADGTGGGTCRHNLRPLCPKRHRIKHETTWPLQTSDTEPPVWVSPLGRHYPVARYDYRPPDDADCDIPTEPEPPDPEPYEPRHEPEPSKPKTTSSTPWETSGRSAIHDGCPF